MHAPALVLCSHGTRSARGRAAIEALVAAVAAACPRIDVRCGYVDVQAPAVESVCAAASDRRGALVPLLLSAGYHVNVDLARAAALAPGLDLAAPLGADERVTDVLLDRLAEAGLAPADAVVLAAAGSSDARAVAGIEAAGARLAARLDRPVMAAHLTAAEPRVVTAVAAARRRVRGTGGRVVVATYLLAPGYFADQAASCGADLVTQPLLVPGEPVPGPLLDLVLDRAGMAAPVGA